MHTYSTRHQGNRVAEIVIALVFSLMFGGCASTQVSDRPANATDFSGTWTLNEDLSEAPAQIARAAARGGRGAGRRAGGAGGGRAGGRGAGGGGRAGGGRTGGGGGRAGGRGADERAGNQPLRELLDSAFPDEDTLVVEQSVDKLRIKFGDQGSSYHGFDSTRFVQIAGQDAEQLSGWQKNEFVVETRTDDDLVVTERWSLSGDGAQITQVVEIASDQLKAPISVTRVFDRTR